MLQASAYKTIHPKTLIHAAEFTLPATIILAGWRHGLFPGIAPTYGAVASAAIMWTIVLLCSCSTALFLMRSKKKDEGLLIVGRDDLARDLSRNGLGTCPAPAVHAATESTTITSSALGTDRLVYWFKLLAV